jgi:hypothetical protein
LTDHDRGGNRLREQCHDGGLHELEFHRASRE